MYWRGERKKKKDEERKNRTKTRNKDQIFSTFFLSP